MLGLTTLQFVCMCYQEFGMYVAWLAIAPLVACVPSICLTAFA